MSGELLRQLVEGDLARRRELRHLRTREVLQAIDSTHVQRGDSRHVNFASNNYLGLTHHPRLVRAAQEAIAVHGTGSGASALVSGYSPAHQAAEADLAEWKTTEAAVLMPSGYQAAHAVVQTIAAISSRGRGGVRFLIDKLSHACLIDAVQASRQPFRIFPHNHLAKLARLLAGAPSGELQVVLTESIFSMDGDAADLQGLCELRRSRPFVLVLDEAHATGVYGPAGAGYAAECRLSADIDISIVTLSKALGLAGGAVCASRLFCDALVNAGRAYVYSTSVPPVLPSAVSAAIRIIRDEPHRQQRLRVLAARVRQRLAQRGLAIRGGDSPIIPVILGAEQRALDAADHLRQRGLWVVAIRPPTVPRNSSRLRITLCCDHTDEEVERLIEAISCLPG